MFKHLFLPWLLPMFGMFFAAGGDALAGVGGEAATVETGDLGDIGGYESGESTEDLSAETNTSQQQTQQTQTQEKEEPEIGEFKGAVSARLRTLTAKAPELAAIFKKHPDIYNQIDATMRREAALRECFPTIAEARQMRETFPGGLADVQTLQDEVKEVQQLETDLFTRGADGNYVGHGKVIDNIFKENQQAAVAFFRGMPKQWAKLDPDSYNDVMGRIVGATIANSREFGDLEEAFASEDPAKLKAGITKIFNWANKFLGDKPKASAEEERLAQDRKKFDGEKADRDAQDGKAFNTSFFTESKKLQNGIIQAHPAIKRLMEQKNVTPQKKAEIIEQIRKNAEKLLGNSTSFMKKLRPAHASRNLNETLSVQRAAWSDQRLLNEQVRKVLNKETPQMVATNKNTIQRRAGTPAKPNTSVQTAPKGPKLVAGRWYRDGGTGAPFTTQEVLAGKHMQ